MSTLQDDLRIIAKHLYGEGTVTYAADDGVTVYIAPPNKPGESHPIVPFNLYGGTTHRSDFLQAFTWHQESPGYISCNGGPIFPVNGSSDLTAHVRAAAYYLRSKQYDEARA